MNGFLISGDEVNSLVGNYINLIRGYDDDDLCGQWIDIKKSCY